VNSISRVSKKTRSEHRVTPVSRLVRVRQRYGLFGASGPTASAAPAGSALGRRGQRQRAAELPSLPHRPPARPLTRNVPAGQNVFGQCTPEPCAQVRILLGAPSDYRRRCPLARHNVFQSTSQAPPPPATGGPPPTTPAARMAPAGLGRVPQPDQFVLVAILKVERVVADADQQVLDRLGGLLPGRLGNHETEEAVRWP
jgi:hypothetical protein